MVSIAPGQPQGRRHTRYSQRKTARQHRRAAGALLYVSAALLESASRAEKSDAGHQRVLRFAARGTLGGDVGGRR